MRAAVPVGAGLALTYAYGTARYRRNARTGYRLDDPPRPGTPAFTRLVEAATGAPWRTGNRVRVLRNGDQTFPAMLDAIAAAKSTVDLSSYIIWPGEITDRFTEALCERAEAGVEVNVVVDAYGSAKWAGHDTVKALEEAGATVVFFRPPAWYAVDKLNNRMHRRLLIVDGRIGFAGGVGIADVWTGNAQDPEHWRETHVEVEGPAVRDILGGFMENWAEAANVVLDGRRTSPTWSTSTTASACRSSAARPAPAGRPPASCSTPPSPAPRSGCGSPPPTSPPTRRSSTCCARRRPGGST